MPQRSCCDGCQEMLCHAGGMQPRLERWMPLGGARAGGLTEGERRLVLQQRQAQVHQRGLLRQGAGARVVERQPLRKWQSWTLSMKCCTRRDPGQPRRCHSGHKACGKRRRACSSSGQSLKQAGDAASLVTPPLFITQHPLVGLPGSIASRQQLSWPEPYTYPESAAGRASSTALSGQLSEPPVTAPASLRAGSHTSGVVALGPAQPHGPAHQLGKRACAALARNRRLQHSLSLPRGLATNTPQALSSPAFMLMR